MGKDSQHLGKPYVPKPVYHYTPVHSLHALPTHPLCCTLPCLALLCIKLHALPHALCSTRVCSLLHTLWPPPVCVVERVGATSCAAARAFARGDEGVCRSRYLRRHVDRSNSRRRRWTELLQHTAGTCLAAHGRHMSKLTWKTRRHV